MKEYWWMELLTPFEFLPILYWHYGASFNREQVKKALLHNTWEDCSDLISLADYFFAQYTDDWKHIRDRVYQELGIKIPSGKFTTNYKIYN